MVTEQPFSQDQDLLLENTNMKLNLDKLVLTYQSQFHYQCFHLQETKDRKNLYIIISIHGDLNFYGKAGYKFFT